MATVSAHLLHSLIPLFFFGMAGSAVVIVVSLFEDLNELFFQEEE